MFIDKSLRWKLGWFFNLSENLGWIFGNLSNRNFQQGFWPWNFRPWLVPRLICDKVYKRRICQNFLVLPQASFFCSKLKISLGFVWYVIRKNFCFWMEKKTFSNLVNGKRRYVKFYFAIFSPEHVLIIVKSLKMWTLIFVYSNYDILRNGWKTFSHDTI